VGAAPPSWGRHPKTFTKAVVLSGPALTQSGSDNIISLPRLLGDIRNPKLVSALFGGPTPFSPIALMNPLPTLSDGRDQSKLLQGRNAVIKADFLDDLAVLELKYGRSGELHLATSISGQ
jgi:hypothetical protein